MAVRVKGSARKTGCAGCFLFFRRPAINGYKSKLLFKSPATVKPAATCSLPCGGGLGRGHSPNGGNLSQYPNRPDTSLAACCPLSNSLPRGERTGWLLGLRVLQTNQVMQVAFYFSDDLQSTVANLSCFSNRLQREICCNLLPPPWGRAGERAFSKSRQSFPTP